MYINSISQTTPSQQTKPSFQRGVHFAEGVLNDIKINPQKYNLKPEKVDGLVQRLNNQQIDLPRIMGVKNTTPELEKLRDVDVNIINIYVDPQTGKKSYLYKIPQLSDGYYMAGTDKSVFESPISMMREVLTSTHKAEIAHKYNLYGVLYKK